MTAIARMSPRMKERSYLWWPGMDGEIEKCVKSCHSCQAHQNNSSKFTPGNGQTNPGWEYTLIMQDPI